MSGMDTTKRIERNGRKVLIKRDGRKYHVVLFHSLRDIFGQVQSVFRMSHANTIANNFLDDIG